MKKVCGIYMISGPNAGKYIGSAKDIAARKRTHMWALRNGRHHSIVLQRAWDKYGEKSFEFTVILVCSESALLFYEQLAMTAFKPQYNILPIAGRTLGAKMPSVAEANRRRTVSPETRAKMSASQKAFHAAPENADRLVGFRSRNGRKQSEETRRKMSIVQKASYAENPERALKVAMVHIGSKRTAETKAKQRAKRVEFFAADPCRGQRIAAANRARKSERVPEIRQLMM